MITSPQFLFSAAVYPGKAFVNYKPVLLFFVVLLIFATFFCFFWFYSFSSSLSRKNNFEFSSLTLTFEQKKVLKTFFFLPVKKNKIHK